VGTVGIAYAPRMGTSDEIFAAWGDTNCFGCSQKNPHGLHVAYESGPDGTGVGHFTPRPEFEGPPGFLHGGLAATAMDEALGWTAHESVEDKWVTGTLEIRYRKPVPLDGGPYRIETETLRHSGRRKRLAGRLLLADGSVAVEGEAVFIKVA